MSGAASQVAIAEADNTLPTRLLAYQPNRAIRDPLISDFGAITDTVVPGPVIPLAADLFDAFNPNISAVIEGVESPIAALNAVAAVWKQLLADSQGPSSLSPGT